MITTGMSRVASSRRKCASTSQPGRSGRCRSSKIRSGGCWRANSISQLALHRGHELNVRPLGQHLFDEREIGEVVFDVENRAFFLIGTTGRKRRSAFHGDDALQRRIYRRPVPPKTSFAMPGNAVRSNGSMHLACTSR